MEMSIEEHGRSLKCVIRGRYVYNGDGANIVLTYLLNYTQHGETSPSFLLDYSVLGPVTGRKITEMSGVKWSPFCIGGP